jgi:CRP/FNR family transcriptional regulator, cyclic AMP receptor protein
LSRDQALTEKSGSVSQSAEITALLSQHPFFSDLPIQVRARLNAYIKTKRYSSGATIFQKGDPGTGLFVVRSGTVKIEVRSSRGKEAVFNLMKAGDFFGEIALLDGLPRTANAMAFPDCELLMIDRRDFMPILQSQPALMSKLLKEICGRLRRTTEQVEDLMFLDLRGRLARTLLRLSETSKTPGKVAVTQRDLAEIVGLSREMINRQLQSWKKSNWVDLGRKEIVILRPDLIGGIVSEDPSA